MPLLPHPSSDPGESRGSFAALPYGPRSPLLFPDQGITRNSQGSGHSSPFCSQMNSRIISDWSQIIFPLIILILLQHPPQPACACLLRAAPLPDLAHTFLPLDGEFGCQPSAWAPFPQGQGSGDGWLVPRARAEGHRGMPQGREVQHCSPSPSRGSGWVRHAGGVLVEEGVLGFQGCPEGVRNQTTASSEACCWKCPVELHCRLRQKGFRAPYLCLGQRQPEMGLPHQHPASSSG